MEIRNQHIGLKHVNALTNHWEKRKILYTSILRNIINMPQYWTQSFDRSIFASFLSFASYWFISWSVTLLLSFFRLSCNRTLNNLLSSPVVLFLMSASSRSSSFVFDLVRSPAGAFDWKMNIGVQQNLLKRDINIKMAHMVFLFLRSDVSSCQS